MAKLTTPDKIVENPYTKLDVDGVKAELVKFQEALKSDANKDIDLAKELNIKPDESTSDSKNKEGKDKDSKNEEKPDEPKPTIDVEAQKKWIGIYENSKEALLETGYKFETVEPSTAKMSEAEKAIAERMDKISQAKFGEQKGEILKVDKDFPVEIIEKLGVSIEDQVTIMSAMKEVASRNTEAVQKVQKELDEKAEIIKDAKFKAPEEAKEAKERVSQARAKFGLLTEEEVKARKEAAYTNRKPT